MYSQNNLIYIFTILEAIEKINIYCKDFEDDEELYIANDQLNFNAVVNLLIAIGEETKKIDNGIKTNYVFYWKDISKMRDKISHNYRGISPYIVWDIIQNFLPEYKEILIQVLPNIEDFKEALNDVVHSKYYMHLEYLNKI
jgi:uncharacterized protein with HEPN domain